MAKRDLVDGLTRQDNGFEPGETEKKYNIDECKGNRPCHVNATCMNTLGSHLCQCHAGYTGNGQNCSDVDECDDGSHLCDENANCTNTNGSHNCICKKGYTGDGKSCQDIDECSDGSNICDENTNCTNFIGSYNCSCTEGYTGSGQSCQDIDECSEAHAVKMNKCHPNASCTNTRGSYNCSCIPGYIGDGFQCKVDPCYEYKNLSDFQRKSSYHTPLNEESCDWELDGWYRFVGAAGTKMPTTSVAPFRCGTASSGWLHGTHPTVEHGVVYRKVCFSSYLRHCRFKTTILVKNCSSYYIYNLFRTPRCDSRYCGTD